MCRYNTACPREFAQAPTSNHCDGVLAYHVRGGSYGSVHLDGLSVVAVASFDGNVWAGEASISLGLFIDEQADTAQREALQLVFSGQAGGFIGNFAQSIGEVRGIEFFPINFEVAGDLASWNVEIANKVTAFAEALSGPTTPKRKHVPVTQPAGIEVGPGQVATWGKTVDNQVDAYGFQWDWTSQSSKHIPFDLSGPAQTGCSST